MNDLLDTGMHKLHLNNGRVLSLFYIPHEDKTLVIANHDGRLVSGNIGDVVGRFREAWAWAGVYVTKYIAGLFEGHSWGIESLPDLKCTLVIYRNADWVSDDGIDGENRVQWYVRLNMPVTDIPGALDGAGRITDQFVWLVCQPLWDMGLQGNTPLSSYSPTGQMCTSLFIHAVGRRVIVSNRHYRDV